MRRKPSHLISSFPLRRERHIAASILILLCSFYSQYDCMAVPVDIEIYGYGLQDPEELAFDSAGNLYAGRSSNSRRITIYQIPAGGGQAIAWPSNSEPFDDPDGIDIDNTGTIWGTTGVRNNRQNGEVVCVSSDGTFDAIGSNYLRNPTSLELDRSGRFGPEGSVIVANQSSLVDGIEILVVTPDPLSVTSIFSTDEYDVIRSLSFDTDNTLWFVGGDNLYGWAQGTSSPEEFVISGITGAISAVSVDPFGDGLIVGLIDERAVARVSLDGTYDIIATGLDPRAFAFDSLGRIYVSDQVSDVIWIVPEPSTLFLLAMGGLVLLRKSGKS